MNCLIRYEMNGVLNNCHEETLYRIHSTMSTLTKGERRLVAVMSAFVGKPPIVLLDEPTAEIDLQTKEVIWKAISNIRGYCE